MYGILYIISIIKQILFYLAMSLRTQTSIGSGTEPGLCSVIRRSPSSASPTHSPAAEGCPTISTPKSLLIWIQGNLPDNKTQFNNLGHMDLEECHPEKSTLELLIVLIVGKYIKKAHNPKTKTLIPFWYGFFITCFWKWGVFLFLS